MKLRNKNHTHINCTCGKSIILTHNESYLSYTCACGTNTRISPDGSRLIVEQTKLSK